MGLNGRPSYMGIDVLNTDELSTDNARENIFTDRELEIIKHVGEGLTSQAISEKLNLSIQTVKTHRNNALTKSGLKNSSQLISMCIRNGYI
jgi:DNA-binding NarL/FixJ family response regulator